MSRLVCFTSEDGMVATCTREDGESVICCGTCDQNPFPGKVIPKDRVLKGCFSNPCASGKPIKMTETDSFTVTVTRFEREGKMFATIEINDGRGSISYCDNEEIIQGAFNKAKTGARRAIDNAGI